MSSRSPDTRAASVWRRAAAIWPRPMILLATTGVLAWEAASPGAPVRSVATIGDLAQSLVGINEASGSASVPAVAAASPSPTPLAPAPRRVLRVAVDPNNYPFSDDRLRGF